MQAWKTSTCVLYLAYLSPRHMRQLYLLQIDTWFPTQGNLESYPHIELTSHQHWNTHKIEFPQKKHSVQEEAEGLNLSKVEYASLGRHLEIQIAH